MPDNSKQTSNFRIAIFVFTAVTTLLFYFLLVSQKLSLSLSQLILSDTVTVVLGLIIGVLSLIKYKTRKKSKYLFIGLGFLTASFVDARYLVTDVNTSRLGDWHFAYSSLVLSIMVLMSWYIWKKEKRLRNLGKNISNYGYYIVFSLVVIGTFYAIGAVGLFNPVNIFRVFNIVSIIVFSLSFFLYLTKGLWKNKFFEYLFIIFSFSSIVWLIGLNIGQNDGILLAVSSIFKNFSYLLALTGLFMSTYAAFVQVEEGGEKLFSQNEELQRIQDTLRGERDRAEKIISSMAEGLLVIGKDYKIDIMNPVAEKLLEVPRKEAVGEQWSDVVVAFEGSQEIPFDDRTSIVVLKTGQTVVTKLEDDHYYKTKSGKMFSVASITAPLLDDSGVVIGAVKVFRDATQEKFTKQEIEKQVVQRTKELEETKEKVSEGWVQVQKEKARLKASINSLSLGYMMTGANNELIIANPAIDIILGQPKDQWTLSGLAEKLSPVDLEKECKKCLTNKVNFEQHDISVGNKIVRIFISPIELKENKEEVLGLVIIIEDVTESTLLERTRDEFFAIASHELRTPIGAIKGNVELIEDHYAKKIKSKELDEMVGDIKEFTNRLEDIVSNFLDVSKLEQQRLEVAKQAVDMTKVVVESVKSLKVQAKAKNLEIVVNSTEGLPNALGDFARARQVVNNLIDNSIKFSEKGIITITVNKDKDKITIAVSDTGIGISVSNQKMLFRKFIQAEDDVLTRSTPHGTGLGLYISKLLAQKMNGEVFLKETVKGQGSTFVFSLPVLDKVATKKEKS